MVVQRDGRWRVAPVEKVVESRGGRWRDVTMIRGPEDGVVPAEVTGDARTWDIFPV